MSEAGDGSERRVTSPVLPEAAVTGDGVSMEDVSEPGTSSDVRNPEPAGVSSPKPSELEEGDDPSGKERETKETNDQEEEHITSSSQAVSSSETIKRSRPSESEMEETEVKNEDEKMVTDQKKSPEETPAGPNANEDTASEQEVDVKQTDDELKEEEDGMQEEKSYLGGKLMVPSSEDLDEMMDIGTVDQMEQEAQMKAEEQNSLKSSCSATELRTVIVPNSAEEEADVKPTASDLMQSSSSEAAASTGRDSSSPPMMLNGMKVVKLSLPRLDDENSEAAPDPIKSSPSPPLAKVKDEPVDEEYDQALVSSTSTASVKDEPGKEDLKIGSVFSVSPAAETQTQPNTSSLHMSCSQCRKNLMKGQTAFQRKGSAALFCSTLCLTTSLPSVRGAHKVCCICQKLIFRPQEAVQIPDGKGNMKEFCSQSCLTTFNLKKNATSTRASASPTKAPQTQSVCSMCSRLSTSKHEVILSGTVHKMCSDACFNRFRTVNNLTMAGCASCGSYCHSKPLMLKMDEGSKTLCNSECLAKYKEKTKVTQLCTMCRNVRLLAEMVDNKNSDDSVNLFCSSSCVMTFKVQTVSSSGS